MSRARRTVLAYVFVSALTAAACSSTASGTLSLITGGETDTFSRPPAPTALEIDAINVDGGVTELARAALPATTVNLPDQNASTIAVLRAEGLDDGGNVLVWGESLPIELEALEDITLQIFVQRRGEFARMPIPLAAAPPSPLLAIINGRFVLAIGGSDPSQAVASQLYDLLSWAPLTAPPTLPLAPVSMATFGTQALLIDDAGTATAFDFSVASGSAVTAPSGGSFADVAGGASVTNAAGETYIVGGTRTTGGATARVLKVDAQGNLTFLTLSAQRLGATATWTASGLCVMGGGGPVEVLGEGQTQSTLSYAKDMTTGAGATALDGSHVLVVGGLDSSSGSDGGIDGGVADGPAATRVFDLSCDPTMTPCAPTAWAATLVPALLSAQAFTLDANTALVVGNDATGTSHAFQVTQAAATEVPFKVARKGAMALRLPTGPVAVVGGAPTPDGGGSTMESFAP